MKPDFRKTMIWLHTYSGLVFGWILLTIWTSGTLSYYNQEISQWMMPELGTQPPAQQIINTSLQELNLRGVDAKRWDISLPNERSNQLKITWADSLKRRAKRESIILQSDTLKPIEPRETKGGQFFRQFHYTLHIRQYGGRYVAGVAAMFMLVALFSGIFTHRRFFRDFFTLRFKKSLKAMADLHAVAGVITIPFCFLISFSALSVYTNMYVPWSMNYHYEDGRQGIDKHIATKLSSVIPSNVATTPINNFDHIEKRIHDIWPEKGAISNIRYEYPFDQNGRIVVSRQERFSVSRKTEKIAFSPHSGELIEVVKPEGVARTTRRVLYGMHEANFAPPTMRFLLFFMGLSSTFLIGSGLVIWLNKRLEKVKERHIGHAIVEKLNISTIMGLLLAIAGYFYANRLLPIGLADRSILEINSFFIIWLCVFGIVMIRPINRAWRELLLVASASYFLLPFVDFFINYQWLLQSIKNHNFIYVGVEFAMLLTGIICLMFYRWLNKKACYVAT